METILYFNSVWFWYTLFMPPPTTSRWRISIISDRFSQKSDIVRFRQSTVRIKQKCGRRSIKTSGISESALKSVGDDGVQSIVEGLKISLFILSAPPPLLSLLYPLLMQQRRLLRFSRPKITSFVLRVFNYSVHNRLYSFSFFLPPLFYRGSRLTRCFFFFFYSRRIVKLIVWTIKMQFNMCYRW